MSERKIIITEDFKNVLSKINSDISHLLLMDSIDENLLAKPEKNFNYIDISRTTKGHISYLTQEKIDKIEATEEKNYWEPKRRYHARPGSFIKKLLKINDYEIEDFTTQFLSIVDPPVFEMKVVKGEDIAKYYNEKSYYDSRGTLGSSCMRYSPSKFFDFYVQNPDQISMLIMLSPNDKIFGRALLWNSPDFKLLDRIYVCIDGYEHHFYEWAKENGYYYKEFNTWKTPTFLMFNGIREFKNLEISIEKSEFECYPYFDTFKWLDVKNKKLYNHIPDGEFITVSDHQGGYLAPDHFAFCEHSKEVFSSDELTFVEYLGMNIAKEYLRYSNVLETFIMVDHSEYCPEINDHYFNKEYDRFNDWDKINNKKKEFEERGKTGSSDCSSSKWDLKWYATRRPLWERHQEPEEKIMEQPIEPIQTDRYTVTFTSDTWED